MNGLAEFHRHLRESLTGAVESFAPHGQRREGLDVQERDRTSTRWQHVTEFIAIATHVSPTHASWSSILADLREGIDLSITRAGFAGTGSFSEPCAWYFTSWESSKSCHLGKSRKIRHDGSVSSSEVANRCSLNLCQSYAMTSECVSR